METQHVSLGERSYPIHVGPGLIAHAGALLAPLLPQPRVIVVTNAVVSAFWLAPLRRSLSAAGIASESIEVPDGEAFKSWSTLRDILTWAIENGLHTYFSTPLNYEPKLHLGFELRHELHALACWHRTEPPRYLMTHLRR